MCGGAIGITYTDDRTPWSYFCFTFFLGGVFSTRLWSALLSLELVIMLVFGVRANSIRWLFFLMGGWGYVSTYIIFIALYVPTYVWIYVLHMCACMCVRMFVPYMYVCTIYENKLMFYHQALCELFCNV